MDKPWLNTPDTGELTASMLVDAESRRGCAVLDEKWSAIQRDAYLSARKFLNQRSVFAKTEQTQDTPEDEGYLDVR